MTSRLPQFQMANPGIVASPATGLLPTSGGGRSPLPLPLLLLAGAGVGIWWYLKHRKAS